MRIVLIPRDDGRAEACARGRAVACAFVLVALLTACGTKDPSVRAEQRDKPVVLTALAPLAEVARDIGGNDVVVVDLTPLGVSPHAIELTARERAEVDDSALAIVVGGGFQPDVEQAAHRRSGPTLDLLRELHLSPRPDGASEPVDPHVWLDPTIMGSISTAIGTAMARVVPSRASTFERRAHDAVEDDVRLDAQLMQGLRSCQQRTLVTQHEAFGWFAARYDLQQIALDGPLSDGAATPDPARADRVTAALEDGDATTVFGEPLTPAGTLAVLARQHNVTTDVLDPYEGRAADDEGAPDTYRAVMLQNLEVLRERLGCDA
ncbi:MAG: zinc transport system substrate-binding protein [Actinomycetota bacterium]|nr:zinc transport system substrate-binding protein [Actinomycetota bacterium]